MYVFDKQAKILKKTNKLNNLENINQIDFSLFFNFFFRNKETIKS